MPDAISGSTANAALLAQLNAQTQAVSGLNAGTSAANLDTTTTMGKDTFLKLLVAQLKYQNPMSPTDGTQFLAQSAQFTMVEKLEEMEKQMTSLVGMQQRIEASGLIGKDVTFHDATTDKDIDGIVTSVDFAGATPSVKVGGKVVPISDLTGVTTPTAPAPTTPAAPAPTPPAGSTTTPTSTSSGS